MKIFNWVHRKFHHKDGSVQNVKKVQSVTNHGDTQVLLEHVSVMDMLDGWKDGILTIGTFGFDPLSSLDQVKEFKFNDDTEEEDEDDEEEYVVDNGSSENEDGDEDESELNPLVYTTFRQDFNGYMDEDVPKHDDFMIDTLNSVSLTPVVEAPGLFESDDHKKNKLERTTLADLFMADSDIKLKINSSKTLQESNEKDVIRTKSGLSFAKKLIPQVGDDSRPIKKLNGLMKRMLKRKIHPEIQGKVNNKEGQIKLSEESYGIESISLLSTQDGVV